MLQTKKGPGIAPEASCLMVIADVVRRGLFELGYDLDVGSAGNA